MQMMKIQINKIISSNWLNIIKSVKHLEKNHSKLHHPFICNNLEASYIGENLCGESSFIAKKLLQNNGINTLVKENHKGIANYRDHVFLLHDSIIVDLTWKQFLQDERSSSIDCKYLQYIQFDLPLYFVGTKEEINFELEKVVNLNRNIFGTINDDLFQIEKWWNNGKDVTFRFNYDRCIESGVIDSRDIFI